MKIFLKSKSGFTLIEVILAVSILSTLTVLVGTATNRALKSKRKIQAEVEDVSTLRDAMRLIKNDINQAYNHYDYEQELLNAANKSATPQKGTQTGAPGNAAGGAPIQGSGFNQANPQISSRENKRLSPATHFEGNEKSINFVTMNNGKVVASDLQADFVEVGYELKSCKNILTDSSLDTQGQCLYRRQQKIIDNDVTKGGIETAVLDNVSEFSVKYMPEGNKTDWTTEWKGKNQFPEAVEINLEITKNHDGKEKKYSLQYVIPLHFTNNQKTTNTQTTESTGATTSSTSGGGNL